MAKSHDITTKSQTQAPTKLCSSCATIKLLSEFYKAADKKHGRGYECKECNKLRVKRWQAGNREKVKKSNAKHYAKNRDSNLSTRKAHQRANKDKYDAAGAVKLAIYHGTITPPDSCSRCDKKCRPDSHHWSYNQEHWLSVIWLCRSCHMGLHAAERQGNK